MDAKVSVIVPVYNTGEYLAPCMESILAQTYRNIELLLVDDGSTDGSGEVCDSYAARDKRVRVIHQSNSGVSTARNTGIHSTAGSYLMFVDGDDWLETDAVAAMLEVITREKADVCFCDRYYRNADVEKLALPSDFPNRLTGGEAVKRHLRYRFLSSACFGLFNASKVKGCLFDPELHTLEDWEYLFRVLTRIDTLAVLRKALYHYRLVEGSASQSPLNAKKLTCLLIPEKAARYVEEHHLPYTEDVKYLPVALLNHLLVILANTEYREKESKQLQQLARRILAYSWSSSVVPLRQKLYTTMCACSPQLFCRAYHIKYGGHYHE